jgi:sugar (pentulose or hexulose) kinase
MEKAGYPINTLRVVGGGAKSKALIQLKADVLGKRIVIPDVKEAGCLGTAMLAYSAHSEKPITELAKQWVKITDEIKPNKSTAPIYNEKFKKFKALYQKIKEINI